MRSRDRLIIQTSQRIQMETQTYELTEKEAKEAWLDVDSYNLEKLFTYDQTELD